GQALQVMTLFAEEKISVAHLPYWYVDALCETMARVNKNYNSKDDVRKDIVWQTLSRATAPTARSSRKRERCAASAISAI
ncbi:MAG: hypothetical protein K2N74_06000, partial [Clostridiales bacterium]|nr:hypothetical protein [Clostridiales bacterium]